MSQSEVSFIRGVRDELTLVEIAQKLYNRVRPNDGFRNKPVVVKVHVGERAADGEEITTHMRPEFVRPFVDIVKSDGASNVVASDSTVNYAGASRSTVQGHIELARLHGFTEERIGSPFVVADEGGDKGGCTAIESKLFVAHTHDKYPRIYIPNLFYNIATQGGFAVVMQHFKGHEIFAYGGAIKNGGMGFVGRLTKSAVHYFKAKVYDENCTACGTCFTEHACTHDAITLTGKEGRAYVDPGICLGCFACPPKCGSGALYIDMSTLGDINTSAGRARVGEFITRSLVIAAKEAYGLFQPEHLLFVTDLTAMTAGCDCDTNVHRHLREKGCDQFLLRNDIGYLASRDPVALDQACIDLVQKYVPPDEWHRKCGVFPFYFPNALSLQTEIAEGLGMGTRKYELVQLDGK